MITIYGCSTSRASSARPGRAAYPPDLPHPSGAPLVDQFSTGLRSPALPIQPPSLKPGARTTPRTQTPAEALANRQSRNGMTGWSCGQLSSCANTDMPGEHTLFGNIVTLILIVGCAGTISRRA